GFSKVVKPRETPSSSRTTPDGFKSETERDPRCTWKGRITKSDWTRKDGGTGSCCARHTATNSMVPAVLWEARKSTSAKTLSGAEGYPAFRRPDTGLRELAKPVLRPEYARLGQSWLFSSELILLIPKL